MEEKKYSDQKGFIKNIAFFGDADISTTNETYTEAYKLAEILAKEGFIPIIPPVIMSHIPRQTAPSQAIPSQSYSSASYNNNDDDDDISNTCWVSGI